MNRLQKLYVYVDESGQDTGGAFFIVGIVLATENRSVLMHRLLDAERQSGKSAVKWHKSKRVKRKKYIESVFNIAQLRESLFVHIDTNASNYNELTARTLVKILSQRCNTSIWIHVDALEQRHINYFKKYFKHSFRAPVHIRGIRKEENDAFIRLADAICGLVRDGHTNKGWETKLVKRLCRNKMLQFI